MLWQKVNGCSQDGHKTLAKEVPNVLSNQVYDKFYVSFVLYYSLPYSPTLLSISLKFLQQEPWKGADGSIYITIFKCCR